MFCRMLTNRPILYKINISRAYTKCSLRSCSVRLKRLYSEGNENFIDSISKSFKMTLNFGGKVG